MLLFTDFRHFSSPNVDTIHESNAFIAHRECQTLKGALFFDAENNKFYLSDCFANAATKKIIRDTGIKPERNMRSIVLNCMKEHLDDRKYRAKLDDISVHNVWTIESMLAIKKLVKDSPKYKHAKWNLHQFDIGSKAYFEAVQKHFGEGIRKQTLESEELNTWFKEFIQYHPNLARIRKHTKSTFKPQQTQA